MYIYLGGNYSITAVVQICKKTTTKTELISFMARI